jgi:hypothetical protein
VHATLAVYNNLADIPVDIIELKRDDLPGAQAEPRQKKQDCSCPAASGCRAIGCRDGSVDFLSGKEWRHSGQSPPTNRQHGHR